jgi:hypothetical protein
MAWTTAKLKRRGFDLTTKVRGEPRFNVRCSQCEAVSINGVPTHETGCPNAKRRNAGWVAGCR